MMVKTIVALTVVCLLCLSTAPTYAKATAFEKAIQRLSQQEKVFILAEGEGISSDSQIGEIDKILASQGQSGAMKIAQIGALCGYRTTAAKGYFLLNRTYERPGEIPCITYEELQESMADVTAILSAICPPTDAPPGSPEAEKKLHTWALYIHLFLKSLSPEQLRTVKKTGLRVGDLTEAERDRFQDILADGAFGGNLPLAREASRQLTGATRGYIYRQKSEKFTTLRYPESVVRTGYVLRPFKVNFGEGRTLDEETQSILTNGLESGQTLADLTKAVSADVKPGEPRLEASSSLQQKPVVFAGVQYVSAQQAATAVKALYGLKIERRTSGLLLARMRPNIPQSYSTVIPSLFQALPLPVRTALFATPSRASGPLQQNPLQNEASSATTRGFQISANATRLFNDSLRNLEVGEKQPVSSLNTTQRTLLGLILVNQFIPVIPKIQAEIARMQQFTDDTKIFANKEQESHGKPRLNFGLTLPGQSEPAIYYNEVPDGGVL